MRARHSIATRVLAALAVITIGSGAVLAHNLLVQRRTLAEFERIVGGYLPVARQLSDMTNEARGLVAVVSERDPIVLRQALRASRSLFPYPSRLRRRVDALEEELLELRSGTATSAEEAFVESAIRIVRELRADSDALEAALDELLEALAQPTPRSEQQRREAASRARRLEQQIVRLATIVDHRTDVVVATARATSERARVRLILAIGTMAALSLLAFVLIRRSLQRLRLLGEAAARIREGDYRAVADVGGRDEIASVAAEFAAMAGAIRERDAVLRRQRDELESAYADRIEAQEALVAAERMAAVGEMSARLAHELRNPLSSIGLNAEMLEDELERTSGSNDEITEMLGTIEREVDRLRDLTESYLQLVRPPGETRPTRSVHRVAEEVVRQLQPELLQVEIEATVSGDRDVDAAVGEEQLRQVLLNLLRNAQQAIAEASGGEILVQCGSDGDTTTVAVHDDGPGLPPEMRSRIFEPFVTTRLKGTGLGLSICHEIVRAAGGSITATASPVLSGACFRVSFPTLRSDAEAASVVAAPPEPRAGDT